MLSTRFSFPWVRIHELTLPKAFWERLKDQSSTGLSSKLMASPPLQWIWHVGRRLTEWQAVEESHGHQNQSLEVSFQHDYWGIPTTCGASKNYNRCMNIDLRQVCHPRSNWFIAGLGNNRFQSGEWWKPLRTYFFIQEVTIFALASQEMFFPSKTMNDEFVAMIVNPVAGLDEWSRDFRTVNVSSSADLSQH